MADELESVSDYLIVILKSHLKLRRDGLKIPKAQEDEFKSIHTDTEAFLSMIIRFYSARRSDFADLLLEIHTQGNTLNRKAKSARDLFIKQISDESVAPNVIIAFNTLFNAYRRVREHAQNLAEAIAGVK
ncbi:hypothetical protein FACS189419_10070 [Planctomycetales bacterium]|nr:hypothetical protein FACS189419_10070 [Planctomycetales bacterium]